MSKLQQQLKAKRLYVYQFQNLTATAEKVGVTKKTLGEWVKKNDWNEIRLKVIRRRLSNKKEPSVSNSMIIEDFKSYLQESRPFLYQRIEPLIDEYITIISEQ